MKYISDDCINKEISQIAIGTGRFGTIVPEELSFEMLDLFVKYGGTVIDTARNYYEWVENGRGKSEACIGKWIESRRIREKICITTKGGVKNPGRIWDFNLSRDNLVCELKESLEALRTDYIDIYLLHKDEKDRAVEEIVETMQYLQELGNIGRIGVANWNIDRIKKANSYAESHGLKPFTVIQTWWSVAEYTKEMWNDENTTHMDNETHQYLVDHDMIGMAYTSQCKGYFQKAVRNGRENVDDFLKRRIETPKNLLILDYLSRLSKKNGVDITDLVNAYITSDNIRSIALVSTSSVEQLLDVVGHCDYEMPYEIIECINGIKDEK